MAMVLFFALRRLDLLDKVFLGRIGIWLWTGATWAGQVLVSRPSWAQSNKTLGIISGGKGSRVDLLRGRINVGIIERYVSRQ
jgi:hypothetical protein